jgi:opacity protein-like surface antigen
MGSVRIAALAAVAVSAITFGTANAADYSCPPPQPYGPPPPPHCLTPPPPPPIEEFGGWYIRGDIGMTNQAVERLENALFATTTNLVMVDKNFESGMLFGLGIGYRWNTWLRFDATGEYRGETGFHGLDTWTAVAPDPNPGPRFNNYTAKKSELLFLANIYADLGTWSGFTPFVGAGIGFSRIGIHSFRDMGTDGLNVTLGYANSAYKWNFAYALHAGVAWELTKHTTVEFAYRYTYLGDGESGDIISYTGANTIYNPMLFKGIDSHDFKLGLRYYFATNTGYQMQVPELLMRRF